MTTREDGIVAKVRAFVETEVKLVASDLEHALLGYSEEDIARLRTIEMIGDPSAARLPT